MKNRLGHFLFFLILLTATPIAQAALSSLILTVQSDQKIQLPDLEILEDPSARLTIDDLQHSDYSNQFVPAKTQPINLGYTRSAWWVRFMVVNDTDIQWFLTVDSVGVSTTSLYTISKKAGKNNPTPDTHALIPSSLFPTYAPKLLKGQPYTVYLKIVDDYSPLKFQVAMTPENQVLAKSQLPTLFLGFTVGGILSLAAYNLFLFFSFRDISYLSLVGFLVGLALEAGQHIFAFIIGSWLYIDYRPLPSLLAVACGVHFFRQLMQTALTAPLLDKLLLFFIWMAVFCLGLLPFVHLTSFIPCLFGITLLPSVALVTIQTGFQGYRIALSFVWAVLILFLSSLPILLGSIGVIALSLYAIYILNIGFLGFALLLSLTQVEHTRELRRNKELAQAENKAKTNFLTTMSHELRTPMNALVGICGLMRMTRLNTEQQDYMNKMNVSSQHMLRLIDNILDLSRIEETGIELNQNVFRLNDVLDDIKAILYNQANRKGLVLVCHHRGFENDKIVGDSTRLAQVLLNLAGNAIKFTEQGRVDIFIREQKTTHGYMQLYFEIQDTGIGISKTQLQYLFQPFAQADNTTQKRYGGSGLGLVISQRIINAMGSTLQFESTPGQGSRFFFTLEFSRPRPSQIKEKTTASTDTETPFSPIRILLVDDDEINCFVVSRYLEVRNIKVTVAENGQKALHLLQEDDTQSFAMILMDVSMPDMDGYETTRQIRALGFKQLPIVALTAHAIMGEKERCFAAGMDDFFTKPFKLQELEHIVRKWA